jgi:hypothetical protein
MTVEQNEAREESRRIIAEQDALIRQLGEALEAILPFIPKTSVKDGCAATYSEAVRAADIVRQAHQDWKARQS